MKNKLIVFDIDGTLTDSVKIHITAFLKVLKKLGVKREEFNFKTFKHHTDSFVAKTIYESEVSQSFNKLIFDEFKIGLYQEVSKSTINEIKGAKQLLEWISLQENIGVCFATGSIHSAAEYKLNEIGINFKAEQLVTSDAYYSREEIVENAIQQANNFYKVEKFDEIISVGDGLWDLKTAQNLGLKFIGVGLENENIMRENGMKNFVTDLIDIKAFL